MSHYCYYYCDGYYTIHINVSEIFEPKITNIIILNHVSLSCFPLKCRQRQSKQAKRRRNHNENYYDYNGNVKNMNPSKQSNFIVVCELSLPLKLSPCKRNTNSEKYHNNKKWCWIFFVNSLFKRVLYASQIKMYGQLQFYEKKTQHSLMHTHV